MTAFERTMAFILTHEGGSTITEDPADPGGLTKYGISQRAHPSVDIRALTEAGALEIYRRDYWDKCRCGELPAGIACVVMDSAVNQGPGAAIKILQAALGVTIDGVIGTKTIAAAQSHRDYRGLIAEVVARRAVSYAHNTLPQITRFGLGWFRRLAACHQLALEVL